MSERCGDVAFAPAGVTLPLRMRLECDREAGHERRDAETARRPRFAPFLGPVRHRMRTAGGRELVWDADGEGALGGA